MPRISHNNVSKEVLTSFGHEENEENNLYNSNEGVKNLPQLLNIKRGRKTDKTDYKIHDRECPDNIRRKVKTHFHNFIVALLNMKVRQILQTWKNIVQNDSRFIC